MDPNTATKYLAAIFEGRYATADYLTWSLPEYVPVICPPADQRKSFVVKGEIKPKKG